MCHLNVKLIIVFIDFLIQNRLELYFLRREVQETVQLLFEFLLEQSAHLTLRLAREILKKTFLFYSYINTPLERDHQEDPRLYRHRQGRLRHLVRRVALRYSEPTIYINALSYSVILIYPNLNAFYLSRLMFHPTFFILLSSIAL